MLMEPLCKWPELEKNSWVQQSNKASREHAGPAVLFTSQPQLDMHFDDSQLFLFFPHAFKHL